MFLKLTLWGYGLQSPLKGAITLSIYYKRSYMNMKSERGAIILNSANLTIQSNILVCQFSFQRISEPGPGICREISVAHNIKQ